MQEQATQPTEFLLHKNDRSWLSYWVGNQHGIEQEYFDSALQSKSLLQLHFFLQSYVLFNCFPLANVRLCWRCSLKRYSVRLPGCYILFYYTRQLFIVFPANESQHFNYPSTRLQCSYRATSKVSLPSKRLYSKPPAVSIRNPISSINFPPRCVLFYSFSLTEKRVSCTLCDVFSTISW